MVDEKNDERFDELVNTMTQKCLSFQMENKITDEQLVTVLQRTLIKMNGPGIAPLNPPARRHKFRRKECQNFHRIFGDFPSRLTTK